MTRNFNYNSKTQLNNGIKVICNFNIPVSGAEEDKVYESRMESLKPKLTTQYLTAIKEVLKRYEYSPLPKKFISNQSIFVTKMPVYDELYGLYKLVGDDIVVDADTICNLYIRLQASFLFGHEMGHKIAKYKATDELYEEMASILGISLNENYYAITETFADECGNMISPIICEHGVLASPLNENKREGIRRLILRNANR
jgi:hypothetical protein